MKVFITGASSGIGAALAERYAELGAHVFLVGRNEQRLSSITKSLPGEHSWAEADVANGDEINAAAEQAIAYYGLPDVVIANAGVSFGTLTECRDDLSAFRELININLIGMVATFLPFAQAMRERGNGTLVGIASVAGVRGLAGAGAYSASKAAVVRYLESLRVELYGSGVDVLCIAPGYIRTPMTAQNPYPMPFILSPEEAAARFVRAIEKRRSYVVIPWQMSLVARLLAVLPNSLYDRIASRFGRKPKRQSSD